MSEMEAANEAVRFCKNALPSRGVPGPHIMVTLTYEILLENSIMVQVLLGPFCSQIAPKHS